MSGSRKVGQSQPQPLAGPLGPFVSGFAADLERRGYAVDTVARQTRMCAGLGGWLEAEGLGLSALSPELVERFCAARRAAGCRDYVSLKGLAPLLEYLDGAGVVRMVSTPAAAGPVEELLDRFRGYLESERRLAPESVSTYACRVRALVERLAGSDRVELERLDACLVRRFVVEVCPRQGRSAAKLTVVAIRALLRFLFLEGDLDRSLAGAVPAVASWRLSGLPKRLEPGQVQRLLDSCDRGTATGQRDFAILTLLVRLGLRVGEVAGLLLGDIDWRAGEVTVLGKGRSHRLPLPADVGDAIAIYLQDGRPRCAEGSTVFVRAVVPHRALGRSGVGQRVVAASRRAGLGDINAHRLRHTAACAMVAAGAGLVEVGQVLGHSQLQTTAIYAKCDRETLRRIARPWPGTHA
jgi:integrase/recombinase XerD